MKVSIVTISFNQARFLEAAIRSVIDQDYPNIEYIVVDPGSTDESRRIIEQYRDRIDIALFGRDTGPPDGLNRGFEAATGDIFGFVNADDMLLPGALELVAGYFMRYPAIDVVSGAGYVIDADGAVVREIFPTRLTPLRYVSGAVTVFQQGTFFTRRAFTSVGGCNVNNMTCWDGELFLDMALAGCKFKLVRERLAAFRVHGGSISGSGRLNARYCEDSEQMFEKVLHRRRTNVDGIWEQIFRVEKWLINADKYLMRSLRAPFESGKRIRFV